MVGLELDNEELPGKYNTRVFIGGNYDFLAKLRKIRKFVADTGFNSVLAFDYDVPRDKIHDFDLRLLHNCKYAIFEVTSPAGELIEIEKATRDYGTTVFLVFEIRDPTQREPPSQISSMLTSLNVPMFGYATYEELQTFISKIFPQIERSPLNTWMELLKMIWLPPEYKSYLTESIQDLVLGVKETKESVKIVNIIKNLNAIIFRQLGIPLKSLSIYKEEVVDKETTKLIPIEEITPKTQLFITMELQIGKKMVESNIRCYVDENLEIKMGPISEEFILKKELIPPKEEKVEYLIKNILSPSVMGPLIGLILSMLVVTLRD